jgi:hypothetical protein
MTALYKFYIIFYYRRLLTRTGMTLRVVVVRFVVVHNCFLFCTGPTCHLHDVRPPKQSRLKEYRH